MDDRDFMPEGRGRSAQKRAAQAVEELARQLVELPEAALANLPLDPELRRELDLARATRGHSSRRRQLKHFAGCLRRHDDRREALEEFLAGHQTARAGETKAFHRLEALRDRLCDAATCEAALDEVREELPSVDLQKLANLARSVHAHGDRKAAREIFRRLRKALEG